MLAHLYRILPGFVSQVRKFSQNILISILIFSMLATKYTCDISNWWVHRIKIYGLMAHLCRILAGFLSQVRRLFWINLVSISIYSILATKYMCDVSNRWVRLIKGYGILVHSCRILAGFSISGAQIFPDYFNFYLNIFCSSYKLQTLRFKHVGVSNFFLKIISQVFYLRCVDFFLDYFNFFLNVFYSSYETIVRRFKQVGASDKNIWNIGSFIQDVIWFFISGAQIFMDYFNL